MFKKKKFKIAIFVQLSWMNISRVLLQNGKITAKYYETI